MGDRPVQQSQRVGLVVVCGVEAEQLHCGDHRLFVRVPFAGDVPLDRSDRHALVRDAVRLGPGGEMREVAAERMCRGVPRCLRTSSNTTTPTPPDVSSTSCSQPRNRSQIIPPPSNRPGRNSCMPLAMAPSRLRTAQPVRWPKSRARTTGDFGLPPASTAIGTGARTCIRLSLSQSFGSHGNLHRDVVVRPVASPAKAVATVRLFLGVRVISTHRSSPIAGCRAAHRLQAASRSLMHARSAGS